MKDSDLERFARALDVRKQIARIEAEIAFWEEFRPLTSTIESDPKYRISSWPWLNVSAWQAARAAAVPALQDMLDTARQDFDSL